MAVNLSADLFHKDDLIKQGLVPSIPTLYRLIKEKKFPAGTKIGGKRFWHRQDIEALFVKPKA